MNNKEAMEYIEDIGKFGSVLGLHNMYELCRRLGNPQDDLTFVHIAGTNGKGSVLSYISAVLKEAGYKTGRYLSPSVFSYREKIQVNARPITQAALCECLELIRTEAEGMSADGMNHPTLFEVETAMAFLYFKNMKCDIVVLETGLGGLLDATNIITTTAAAVFTSISMDHMHFLGNTQEEIAENKAGIMKKGCLAISMKQEECVRKVLEKKAEAMGCPILFSKQEKITGVKYGLDKQRFSYHGYKNLEITLAGQFQIENAALAVDVIAALVEKGCPVSENQLRRGLLAAKWRGRFSVIGRKPFFIADGAHNEDAAIRLMESIRFYFTNKRMIYIMGVLRDKDYDRIIQITEEAADQIITVAAPGNPRALPAYELAGAVSVYHHKVTAVDSPEEAVELAYLLADQQSVIIAFGSLSYLGDLIKIVENRESIRRDSHGKSGKN